MNSIAQSKPQNNPHLPLVQSNQHFDPTIWHSHIDNIVLRPAANLQHHNGFTPGYMELVALQFYSETEALCVEFADLLTKWEAEDQEMRDR